MKIAATNELLHRTTLLSSLHLNREVKVECWFRGKLPPGAEYHLILINDGQLLEEAGFSELLSQFQERVDAPPLFCVGIHAGRERLMEYGTMRERDYLGRGAKAKLYARFVLEELLPWLRRQYRIYSFREKVFAGFSLGALSALDIVWNHPQEFSKAGVFSGSLWWRNLAFNDAGYTDEQHRIMHNQIRAGNYYPWLRFFFECGTEDETADRNNNGIIDSIDDTTDLLEELKKKGYGNKQCTYYEIEGGKHDAKTWGEGWKAFLEWGWGKGRTHV